MGAGFEVVGEAGAGLVVHVPHGGTVVPDEVRRGLLVDDQRLEAELLVLTDWLTPRLFVPPAHAVGAVALVNRVSRLVVDHERLPDAREPLAPLGLGAIYTRTADGQRLRDERDIAQRVRLLDEWFHPWAAAAERLVDAALERHGRCLVLDAHSFPSRPLPYEDPALARPDVCLGFEDPHAPADLVDALEKRITRDGLTVARNQPFAGAYVPLRHYGTDRAVRSVMIEVNRALYLDEGTGEPGPGFAATRALVADLVAIAAEEAPA